MTPTGYTVAGLAAVLALSLAGNAMLARGYMHQREQVAKTEEARAQAVDAATTCGESVRAMGRASEEQRKTAEAAIAAAAKTARDAGRRADAERNRAQAVPGDACASAQVENREWLQARRGAQ